MAQHMNTNSFRAIVTLSKTENRHAFIFEIHMSNYQKCSVPSIGIMIGIGKLVT